MRDKKPGFDSEFTGDVLKIKLRGELDHHSAVAIRTQIDDMIRSKRPKTLNIDMSVIDFMDSSGLGLIMGRYAVMKDIGGEMCVCDPSVRVQKIMSLAGMERMVNISYSNGNQGTSGQAVKRAAPRKRGVR
ncbi:MAG: anti-sigma factor antagonist [Clostridia bacterium]|nr:anti-sigma factor antagonist [Clostridia bacterium]